MSFLALWPYTVVTIAVYSKARGRDAHQQVHAIHFSQGARKTAS